MYDTESLLVTVCNITLNPNPKFKKTENKIKIKIKIKIKSIVCNSDTNSCRNTI